MLFRRTTLFRFFGFDVCADASWLFLSVFITWTLASHVFPEMLPGLANDTYQVMGVMALGALIFSIIAHEVAHAVIAEYYHMPIRAIVLFVFGGVAEMKGEPSHARGEFFMALAGPIMSFLLGLFFAAAAALVRPLPNSEILHALCSYLGTINFFIAAFNLLPAFPLDGGRALRAFLWHRKSNLVLATRQASRISAVFAYAMMACGCLLLVHHDDIVGGAWLTVLGLFVFACATQAVRDSESASLLSRETVARFMRAQVTAISPDQTIADMVERHVFADCQSDYPVTEGKKLVGVLPLATVLKLDRAKWPWLHVATLMEPVSGENTVSLDTAASEALNVLQRSRRGQLSVMDKNGTLCGVIAHRDLAAYLSVVARIDQDRPVAVSR